MGSYSLTLEWIKILVFLAILSAAAYVVVRLSGRSRPRGGAAKELTILETLSLGGTRFLCLVRIGRNRLLLGVTDHSITCLSHYPDETGGTDENPVEGSGSAGLEQGASAGGLDAPVKRGIPGTSFLDTLHREFRSSWRRLRGKGPFFLAFAVLILVTTFPRCGACQPGGAAPLPIPNIEIRIGGEGGGGGLLSALGILAVLTVLSLAPAILILTTSFTRIIVVFSFLRAGLGTQQTPANQILIGLALLMTFLIMAPVWNQVNAVAVQPYVRGEIDAAEAWQRGVVPVRDFMLRQTRQKDLALFLDMQGGNPPAGPEDLSVFVVAPAFVISELKTAFEIGFMLFLPFLVIDMIVASTLMSMGMLMLPPVLISLPFKILLFVLVDGWGLLAQSLMKSFK
ncbi:MAG TPA: flagellar type III secretion system pore protein FliP [Firmicutes bacterium]|nr:flagellar type III secretion system pore protein FliP [Candidatus Fermentithermobacillaceae bacterium]